MSTLATWEVGHVGRSELGALSIGIVYMKIGFYASFLLTMSFVYIFLKLYYSIQRRQYSSKTTTAAIRTRAGCASWARHVQLAGEALLFASSNREGFVYIFFARLKLWTDILTYYVMKDEGTAIDIRALVASCFF